MPKWAICGGPDDDCCGESRRSETATPRSHRSHSGKTESVISYSSRASAQSPRSGGALSPSSARTRRRTYSKESIESLFGSQQSKNCPLVMVPRTPMEERSLSPPLPRPCTVQAQHLHQVQEVQSPQHGNTKRQHVAIIAPGAGLGRNRDVYAGLAADPCFHCEILGQARAPYDRYPQQWPNGAHAPNLESFALELLAQGVMERADCLVFGSRGGQVVLPTFWKIRGSVVPPAVIINGGVAMSLPIHVKWPDLAVTFLLIGGQDFFRGTLSPEQHLLDIKSRVPKRNGTTAILYVREMHHVPQTPLLQLTLPLMLRLLKLWFNGQTDELNDGMQELTAALSFGGWSGELHFTPSPDDWEELAFDATGSNAEMSPASRMRPRKTSPAGMLVSPRMSMPPAALNLILPGVRPRARSTSPPRPPMKARAKTVNFSLVEQQQILASPKPGPQLSSSLELVVSPQSMRRKSMPGASSPGSSSPGASIFFSPPSPGQSTISVPGPSGTASPGPPATISPMAAVSPASKIVRFMSQPSVPSARAASPVAVARSSLRHPSPQPLSSVAPLQVLNRSPLRRRTSPAAVRSSAAPQPAVVAAPPNIGRACNAVVSPPLRIA